MGVINVNRSTVRWKIAKLRDHPRQAAMFGDVDEEELNALAENMAKRGLQDPIHILPDGTVIAGHQRVRAAKQLGWTEIDVVVRNDLAEAGDEAVEEIFIEDNFVRRQLSPLARAKCIRRLMELEEGREVHRFGFARKEELKARIASRMKLSPRSVSRYLLLLEAPSVVQQVFDRGLISQTVAGKVALLSKKAQAEVAERIEAGEKPSAVIAECTNGGESADKARAFVRLISCLRREIPSLKGQASKIPAGRLIRSATTIHEAALAFEEFTAAAGRKVKK